jgi:hypothetical protein
MNSGRLLTFTAPDAGRFRMAHAKNMAHRLGIMEGADILVNLDADNFTGAKFASYLAGQFDPARRMFMWSRMIKEGPDRLTRGITGRIAVTPSAFLIAGGYDEKFDTWSPDDRDFNFRLQRLGYDPVEIDKRYLQAVPHNDKVRFREYQHAKHRPADYYGDDVFDPDGPTIANWGNIGCGTVFRNFSKQAWKLPPLPARIFGIGMHKTATTSLHHALEILGFDSAHWKSAHWAKAIREEMRAGRSLTVDKHYALSDMPIGLLYHELDAAYPGSKFILTMRKEEKWLRSVERHWSHDHNPFRAAWNSDPYSHKLHKELYGQKGFNAEIFLARYRRHNAEVCDYFRERPSDLLVMHMDGGDGWNQLCPFLGVVQPETPYPVAFATAPAPAEFLAAGI